MAHHGMSPDSDVSETSTRPPSLAAIASAQHGLGAGRHTAKLQESLQSGQRDTPEVLTDQQASAPYFPSRLQPSSSHHGQPHDQHQLANQDQDPGQSQQLEPLIKQLCVYNAHPQHGRCACVYVVLDCPDFKHFRNDCRCHAMPLAAFQCGNATRANYRFCSQHPYPVYLVFHDSTICWLQSLQELAAVLECGKVTFQGVQGPPPLPVRPPKPAQPPPAAVPKKSKKKPAKPAAPPPAAPPPAASGDSATLVLWKPDCKLTYNSRSRRRRDASEMQLTRLPLGQEVTSSSMCKGIVLWYPKELQEGESADLTELEGALCGNPACYTEHTCNEHQGQLCILHMGQGQTLLLGGPKELTSALGIAGAELCGECFETVARPKRRQQQGEAVPRTFKSVAYWAHVGTAAAVGALLGLICTQNRG